ncbi:MAG: F0F1 ATP synthase subunit B [Hyphomicrobiales bacterium]|nr:F0F1 ATP synthase subunit B [Hyphomicrobiales bacterium]
MFDPAKPDFWVAVSFLAFIGLLLYLKVFKKVAQALDNRAADIKRQLDEAKRLRDEARGILEDYKRKQRNAEREAAEIVEAAKREAENYASETKAAFAAMLERRTRIAEEKIARAEAQVIEDARNKAIDIAVAAAETVIAEKLAGDAGKEKVAEGIRAVGSRLN